MMMMVGLGIDKWQEAMDYILRLTRITLLLATDKH